MPSDDETFKPMTRAEAERLADMIDSCLVLARAELRGGHGTRAIELLKEAKAIADRLPKKADACQTKSKPDNSG
jgi:hypothetical protein